MARERDEYAELSCRAPHTIPPAPAIMITGVAALLALLLDATIPTTRVTAPTAAESAPRRWLSRNSFASVSARADPATIFSAFAVLKIPAVPTTRPSAP